MQLVFWEIPRKRSQKIVVYFSAKMCYTIKERAGMGRPGHTYAPHTAHKKEIICRRFFQKRAIQGRIWDKRLLTCVVRFSDVIM